MKKLCVIVLLVLACAGPKVVSAERHSAMAAPVGTKLVCHGHGAWKTLLATTEKSPLFALLQSKVGEPVSCVISDEAMTLKFAKGASLDVAFDSETEYVSHEAVFPSGVTVSRDEAVECLKKAAAATGAFPAMQMDWTQFAGPIPSGSVDKRVDGDACNFWVHIHMENGVVVGLGDSIAC